MQGLKSRAKTVSRGSLIIRGRPDEQTLASVIDRATTVIGDRDAAMRWLGTPVRALDFATPISVLGSAKGVARVKDVLGQIEHGVW
jgi:putative toxin-antitoxin system antitoxin component (TIGR02293 family)